MHYGMVMRMAFETPWLYLNLEITVRLQHEEHRSYRAIRNKTQRKLRLNLSGSVPVLTNQNLNQHYSFVSVCEFEMMDIYFQLYSKMNHNTFSVSLSTLFDFDLKQRAVITY